jgi:hypothetical protein
LPSPNSRNFGPPWTSTHQCTMKDGSEICGRVLKGLFQICYLLLMVVDSSSYWSLVHRRTTMMLCSCCCCCSRVLVSTTNLTWPGFGPENKETSENLS